MAIVPGIDETPNLEGSQTIVAGEPQDTGVGPDSLSYTAPSYLQSQYTPLPKVDSSTLAAAASGGHTQDFSGGTGSSTSLRDKMVAAGMRFIGQPYVWGALDCSGLMQKTYAAIGVKLPRISYQQANYGQKTALNKLMTGDLVAWDEGPRNPGADHIAMFIGYDKQGRPQILEAAHTGTDVRVRTLGANEGAWGVHINLPGD